MQFNNNTRSGLFNNPLVNSVFDQSTNMGAVSPEPSDYLITENDFYITTESGIYLVTED